MGSAKSHRFGRKGKSTAIVTLGIDPAKNVFAVHGADAAARSGPHHWARLFQAHGHTVRLLVHPARQGFVAQRTANGVAPLE